MFDRSQKVPVSNLFVIIYHFLPQCCPFKVTLSTFTKTKSLLNDAEGQNLLIAVNKVRKNANKHGQTLFIF